MVGERSCNRIPSFRHSGHIVWLHLLLHGGDLCLLLYYSAVRAAKLWGKFETSWRSNPWRKPRRPNAKVSWKSAAADHISGGAVLGGGRDHAVPGAAASAVIVLLNWKYGNIAGELFWTVDRRGRHPRHIL